MSYATRSRQTDQAFSSEDREIVFAYDLSGRFTFLNETGELILGYSREEACQMNISQLIAPELVDLVLAPADESSKMPGVVYEVDLVAKDGRRIALEVSTHAVMRNGRPFEIEGIALPSVLRDPTDLPTNSRCLDETSASYADLILGRESQSSTC